MEELSIPEGGRSWWDLDQKKDISTDISSNAFLWKQINWLVMILSWSQAWRGKHAASGGDTTSQSLDPRNCPGPLPTHLSEDYVCHNPGFRSDCGAVNLKKMGAWNLTRGLVEAMWRVTVRGFKNSKSAYGLWGWPARMQPRVIRSQKAHCHFSPFHSHVWGGN